MKTEKMSYIRPTSLEELKQAIANVRSYALLAGGGSAKPGVDVRLLVDTQALGLDQANWDGQNLKVGGLATLSQLGHSLSHLQDFGQTLAIESGLNVRNTLSLSNWLSMAAGRSPVLCGLRALDARVKMFISGRELTLEEFLRCQLQIDDKLVGELEIPATRPFAFESVGRTPLDLPILCVGVSEVEPGKYRIAVGGPDMLLPVLYLEGYENSGEAEIRRLLKTSDDQWASAGYRQDLGATLLARCLQKCIQQASNKETR